MNNTDIKFRAVAHYLRMMYAVCYDSDFYPDSISWETMMLEIIGECWTGKFCDYCNNNDECFTCELRLNHSCCDRLWNKMSRSDSWHEWLKNAHKVLEYIIENG